MGWAVGVVSELEAKRAGLADKADHKIYFDLIGLTAQIKFFDRARAAARAFHSSATQLLPVLHGLLPLRQRVVKLGHSMACTRPSAVCTKRRPAPKTGGT